MSYEPRNSKPHDTGSYTNSTGNDALSSSERKERYSRSDYRDRDMNRDYQNHRDQKDTRYRRRSASPESRSYDRLATDDRRGRRDREEKNYKDNRDSRGGDRDDKTTRDRKYYESLRRSEKSREWDRDSDRNTREDNGRSRFRGRERDREYEDENIFSNEYRKKPSFDDGKHDTNKWENDRYQGKQKEKTPTEDSTVQQEPEKPLEEDKAEKELTEEEKQMKMMQEMMGFGSFDTTKGKKMAGTKSGAVAKVKVSKYRQYM